MSVAALTVLAVEGEEHANELPVEPWMLGVGTFLVLCALLLITWQFNRD